MDAYETGYAFGRLIGTLVCLFVPLALVGGVIWFAVARSRRKSRPAPYGALPPYPYPGQGGPPSYPAPYPPTAAQQPHPAPQQQYPAPQQQYPAPQQQYPAPQQQYPAPGQPYSAPQQPYQAPEQPYPAPPRQPPWGSGH